MAALRFDAERSVDALEDRDSGGDARADAKNRQMLKEAGKAPAAAAEVPENRVIAAQSPDEQLLIKLRGQVYLIE